MAGTVGDGLAHLRRWIRSKANVADPQDLMAVAYFNELLESSSILAAELDTISAGGAEKNEDDLMLLDKSMTTGRAAAEIAPLSLSEKSKGVHRSKDWWAKKAKKEGDSAVGAGRGAVEAVGKMLDQKAKK